MLFLFDALLVIPFAIVLLTPIYLALSQRRFGPALFLTVIIVFVFTFIFRGMKYELVDVKLWWLGADMNGFLFSEILSTVAPEDRDRAQDLLNAEMGIAWQLSAMFQFVFLSLPYSLLTFSTIRLVRRIRTRRRSA